MKLVMRNAFVYKLEAVAINLFGIEFFESEQDFFAGNASHHRSVVFFFTRRIL